MQTQPAAESGTATVAADTQILLTAEQYEALKAKEAELQALEEADRILPPAPEITEGAAGDAEALTEEIEGSALADLVDVDLMREWLARGLTWVQTDLLTVNSAVQLALILGAVIPAVIFGPRLKNFVARHLRKQMPSGILRRVADAVAVLATPIAAWITLTVFMGILGGGMNQNDQFVSAAQSLLAAWIVVRIVTLAIRSPFWSKVAFFVAWPIAAMDAFGVLGDVFDWMKARSFELAPAVGDTPAQVLSLYDVLRAGLIFAVFLVAANFLVSFITGQLDKTDELNVSLKALIAKVLGFVMPVIALLMALAFIGFDLGSLAIFGGAVGLGIGLGLQKIIANFLAGFTLLADRSIKPGDVIEVEDTFGWVTEMKGRYVSLRTRDGKEHLVPNATFMEEGVTNWSHSDKVVCCYAYMGVGYGTPDMERVIEIVQGCALDTDRVLARPEPRCNMTEFGDNSVNFELRFWINDPVNGISNVRSDILRKVWIAFAEEGIEIPFPQRDLHIKSSDVPLGGVSARGA